MRLNKAIDAPSQPPVRRLSAGMTTGEDVTDELFRWGVWLGRPEAIPPRVIDSI
ncbi:hypothetical protein [Halohasta litorea]|uniref:Uncharacterized protein n=1 Tax=Halohasta litorea TaxID=869891 RepID=A0ABD6D7M3_9EURY|nr:hypothetical protein [Halohasta litorea]